jgi:hypothetical protein
MTEASMIERRPGFRFDGALVPVLLTAGPNRVLTAALRDEAGWWVATFPGSDHLAMERRPDGSR